jgi:hypothetical protein
MMNLNKLSILSIVAVLVFVFPVFAVSQEGEPFKALQEQIDELRQQINNIQGYPIKAYSARSHYDNMPQSEEWVPVITLSLPEGDFIMTITMMATFFHDGSYNSDYQTFVDCICVDQDEEEIQGCGLAGGVTGAENLAVTFEQPLFEETNVTTLYCRHSSWSDDPMTIHGLQWTAIKVDELDIQIEQ